LWAQNINPDTSNSNPDNLKTRHTAKPRSIHLPARGKNNCSYEQKKIWVKLTQIIQQALRAMPPQSDKGNQIHDVRKIVKFSD
jgi:hypothetical protein